MENELNLRKKAETLAASAEEKARLLERQLSSLTESTEREKSRLQKEVIQMEREAKLSVSRISANVSNLFYENVDCLLINWLLIYSSFTIRWKEWNAEQNMLRQNQGY